MNRQRRQEAKKKRRERDYRAARQRRLESDHCKALIMEADAIWLTKGDAGQALKLLEKAVRIHPGSHEAHERLAELHIRGNRFVQGLAHYERLSRPPDFPQLTYLAAFCLAGSLEESMLKVLHDKLNLFELVAGEIEMILGEFDAERQFADVVMDLWAGSATRGERDSAFDHLADELIAARWRYEKTQETDRALFRDEFEA